MWRCYKVTLVIVGAAPAIKITYPQTLAASGLTKVASGPSGSTEQICCCLRTIRVASGPSQVASGPSGCLRTMYGKKFASALCGRTRLLPLWLVLVTLGYVLIFVPLLYPAEYFIIIEISQGSDCIIMSRTPRISVVSCFFFTLNFFSRMAVRSLRILTKNKHNRAQSLQK